jgi:hypothetical protein
MPDYPTLWFWRSDSLMDGWNAVESFATDEHPHPSTIESNVRPTGADPFSRVSLNGQHLTVHVDHAHLPKAPSLWYLLINYNDMIGGVAALMAFADKRFTDGTVLDADQFRLTGKTAADQVAAIKWRRSDATIEQIYVANEFRRRGLAVKLINVADALVVASRTDGYLNGGGHLTDDGAALASQWNHSARLSQRVGSYSPMDTQNS